MLQIIRDLKHIDDANANSFVKAIKRQAEKEGVIVIEKLLNDESGVGYVYLTTPSIVIQPCGIKVKAYNNADNNETAKVVADICKSYFHQRILLINRTELIGLPLHKMLVNQDHTVTMAHSKSGLTQKDIDNVDLIIFATGVNQLKFDCSGKIVVDISGDYDGGKCGVYYDMHQIGKKTVERIIANARRA